MSAGRHPLTAIPVDWGYPLALLRAVYHFSSAELADLDERQVDCYIAQVGEVEQFRAQFLALSLALGQRKA